MSVGWGRWQILAPVLAVALVPQGSLAAAATEAKVRKPQASKGTDIAPWTVAHDPSFDDWRRDRAGRRAAAASDGRRGVS
jgi:hypothetical protein